MSKKLQLTPDISYVLGLYACGSRTDIGVETNSIDLLARFARIAIEELDADPKKLLVEEHSKRTKAFFFNSKLKKLFDKALDRRENLFKYKNDYSANYFAGIYDCKGGKDAKGLYLKDLDTRDDIMLEKLGFRTKVAGSKKYLISEKAFIDFIKKFSARI